MKKIESNKYTLKFKSRKDEDEYNSYISDELSLQVKFGLFFTFVFHLILSLRELLILDNSVEYYWGFGILFSLFSLYQVFYAFSEKIKVRRLQVYLFLTVLIPLLVMSMLALVSDYNADYFIFGVISFLFAFGILFMGIKFFNSLILSSIFFILYEIVVIITFFQDDLAKNSFFNFLIIPTVILVLLASYILEKERRNNFIKFKLLKYKSTEIDEMSDELSDSGKSIKNVISEIPILILSIDENLNINFWNKMCEKVTGYDEINIVNNENAIELLFPDAKYRSKILKYFVNGKGPQNFEVRMTTTAGLKRIISWKRIKRYYHISNSPNWFAGTDITDDFKIWKELQKSEQQLKDAQGLAHIGSWDWNLKTDKIFWSEEMCRMFGIEPNDDSINVKDVFIKAIYPHELKRYYALIDASIKEKKTIAFEYRILGAEGTERIMRMEGDVTLNRKSEVVRLSGSNLDITDIKQVEVKLYQITKSLEKAQKLAKIGSWGYDYFTKQTFASEEFYRIFDIDKDIAVILPEPLDKLVIEEDKINFEKFFEQALIENVSCEAEFRIKNKKNEIKIINTIAEIEKDNKNSKIKSVNIIFRDVSLFKSILEQISKSEQKFKNIIKSSPDGIIVFDQDGNISDYNTALQNIIGLNDDKFSNIRLPDVFTEKEFSKFSEKIVQLVDKGKTFRNQPFSMIKNSKDNISVEISAEIVESDTEESILIVAIIKDITNRLKYETKLKEARLKAENADKLKSSFLANMSHEIRTPMNAIVGFSNLLSEPDLEEDEKSEYINYIISNSATLLTLIDDIVDISKIEAGQIKIKKADVNLNELFDDIYASTLEQRKIFEKNDVQLIKEIAPDLQNSVIVIDYIRVKQVFVNLINNALKFTEKGHVIFGVEIAKFMHLDVLNFYVKDSGIGIQKEDLGIIFNQFVKIEQYEQTLLRGTGLGLTISRKLVTLMGGKLSVESEYGKGSEFTFTLPFKAVKVAASENDDIKNNTKVDWSYLTILIVEDEFTNFKYLETVLLKQNVNILSAVNGVEAVDIVNKTQDINLILMDIRMPEMDGYEATKLIKKIMPKIPIIAQTAFAMNTEKEKINESGFDDYIAKPVDKNKLLRLIEKHT